MFRSEYIDLAIGLAVVFFLTSLIVSGLNEGLQWTFRVRAKFLWSYLFDLADPARLKTLPRGVLGIAHLWKKTNDKRPPVRNDEEEARAVVAGGAVDPDKMIKRVANALDPLDVPDVTGKGGKKKTTIQNVPASSLAQAFLEVFADIGKERIADDLVQVGRDYAGAADKAALLKPVVARLVPDGETPPAPPAAGAPPPAPDPQAATLDALEAYFDAATNPNAADPVPALEAALRALPGVSVAPSLKKAATDYVAAVRGRAAAGTDKALVDAAGGLAGALARTFAKGFSRERIDIAVDSLKNAPLGPTARRLWEAAEGDIDKFRASLQGYFDGEMKRLSGYYRRSIRIVMIGLAIVVAVVCNVDAVSLARDLWRNPEGRAALVAQADTLTAPTTTPTSGTPPTSAPGNADIATIAAKCRESASTTTETFASADDAAKAFNDVRACVTDALNTQTGLNVVDNALWITPSGWADQWTTYDRQWWVHLLGVIATAVALVLGAPFWFDILKRLTGIRRTTQA